MVAAEALNQVIAGTAVVPGNPTQTLTQRRTRGSAQYPVDQVDARASIGLAGVLTIVAIGPFDNHIYARQLAAAFIAVRQRCDAQLVLLGSGAHCTTVMRRSSAPGVGNRVRVVSDSSDDRWLEVVAAADLVVLSSSSGMATLLDVLDSGRPVVAPAEPAIVQLVVPAIAGLVYAPGDVSGMTAALLRLVTTPVLRRGMAGRARNVARRHRLETTVRHRSEDRNRI
jgi:glycosyltransferase involved in cell wall biosynthesis